MPRAQCIVVRGNKVLMVKHRQGGQEWWCLPGGGVDENESPADAALRELEEECGVQGSILRQTSHVVYSPTDQTITFLVKIGDQQTHLGSDPEFSSESQILVDLRWLSLHDLAERDRAFLWQGGLLGVGTFWDEIEHWGDEISYPGSPM